MGRRRMKYKDYGKMAMSFYYIPTKKAVRVKPINDDRPPEGPDLKEFWAKYTDEELFKWENVEIIVDENDLPGKPKDHAVCSQCGENILDGRQVVDNGVIKCRACANGAYYKIID